MILDGLLLMVGDVDADTGALVPENFTAIGATAATGVVDTAIPILPDQPRMTGAGQARDLGGDDVNIELRVVSQPASAGAATIQVQVCSADDGYLQVNPTLLYASDVFTLAQLPAGRRIALKWPRCPSNVTLRRYVGVRIVVGGFPLTNAAGWLWGGVVLDVFDGDRFFNVRWKLDA